MSHFNGISQALHSKLEWLRKTYWIAPLLHCRGMSCRGHRPFCRLGRPLPRRQRRHRWRRGRRRRRRPLLAAVVRVRGRCGGGGVVGVHVVVVGVARSTLLLLHLLGQGRHGVGRQADVPAPSPLRRRHRVLRVSPGSPVGPVPHPWLRLPRGVVHANGLVKVMHVYADLLQRRKWERKIGIVRVASLGEVIKKHPSKNKSLISWTDRKGFVFILPFFLWSSVLRILNLKSWLVISGASNVLSTHGHWMHHSPSVEG